MPSDNGPVVKPLAASSLFDRTTVIFHFESLCTGQLTRKLPIVRLGPFRGRCDAVFI
jgi:hypothetical protein